MRPEQEYSIALAIFNSRFIRALLVLVVLTLGWKVAVSTGQYVTWQREERAAIAAHVSLLARQASMQKKLHMLTSPEEKEMVVRQAFTVKRPGEETVIIVDHTETDAAPSTTTPAWYKRMWIWTYFGN